MELRPYQNELLDKARSAFAKGNARVLIQLPTGGGKTVLLSEVCRTATSKNLKVLVMVHRKEILEQIVATLHTFGLSTSIIDARTRTSSYPTGAIVCAMQQTLTNRVDTLAAPDLLITDEAHHQAAAGYKKITEAWPSARVIGLTATPCRLDGKPLNECFDDLVLGPTTRDLIDMGALAEFRYLAPPFDPKLFEGIKKIGGDYSKSQLEAAVTEKHLVGDIVKHYIEQFNGKPVIAFCVTVEHARVIADAFRREGFRAESVDGGMKREQRDDIMERFRTGAVSILCSCDLIREGFDVPNCAGALLLRPTKSLTIFLQQVGRALRVKDDGSKAILLDHAGNCYEHGRPDDPREWSLEGSVKAQNVNIRQCPQCYMVIDPNEPTALNCPEDPCHYDKDEGARNMDIVHHDGELVEYKPPVTLEWAGKQLDVKTAAGKDYSRLLRAAGTNRERLEQIASIRGYKKNWVDVRLAQVKRGKARYAIRS